jgi:hypothetical protein
MFCNKLEIKYKFYEEKIMVCEYCRYRNSYECDDGWNRRSNCSEFELDWNTLSNKDKRTIQKILESRSW